MADLTALKEYYSSQAETAATSAKTEPLQTGILTAHIEDERARREQAKAEADNTKRSEQLRIKITKDILGGVAVHEILLTALECISVMTGDTAFSEQNRQQLQAQGVVVGDKVAVAIELQELRERAERMKRRQVDTSGDERQRLDNAIKQHELRIKQLES
jgi:hypothetical protein